MTSEMLRTESIWSRCHSKDLSKKPAYPKIVAIQGSQNISKMRSITESKLYDQDYSLWLQETIFYLKESNFQEIDLLNLIEELEDMGRSEKRSIYSNLKVVLMHLLKYRHQPMLRSNSWRGSIREHRQRLKRAFKESPSLQGYLQEILAECYQDAREWAAAETGLLLDIFESDCPFSSEEILNPEYLPD